MSKWKKAKERLVANPDDYSVGELIEFLSSIGFRRLCDDELSEGYISLYSKSEKRMIVLPSKSPVPVTILKALTERFMENGDI